MSRLEEAMNKARQLRGADGRVGPSEAAEPRTPPLPKPVPRVEIELQNPLLVAASNDNVPVAEEYRKLKSMVVQITKKKGFCNTLMVTSAVSGEGKSITALNLAISIAQEHDHSVLLVDADLRNPSLCGYLGLEPHAGLANCLMDGTDIGEALIRTGIGNLTLLPAGKRVVNPVELFSSQTMKDLLDQIKHRYADRYVVFDTPPLLPFAETRLLGTRMDGVVFVVKEGGPSLQSVTEALESLKDANVLGIVYNEASETSLDSGYYSYYYDYGRKSRGSAALDAGKRSFVSRIMKPKGGK
jgi:exopolysaccharide/PEP-CTERM locus tyrosine autokinase